MIAHRRPIAPHSPSRKRPMIARRPWKQPTPHTREVSAAAPKRAGRLHQRQCDGIKDSAMDDQRFKVQVWATIIIAGLAVIATASGAYRTW